MTPLRPLLALILAFGGAPMAALDALAAESKASKSRDNALDAMFESLTPYLKEDAPAYKTMRTSEKAAFLHDKAAVLIKAQAAKKARSAVDDKFKEYLKKAVEVKAVRDIAIPQMVHALSTGYKYDAALMDARVASAVDTNLSALASVWEGAKVGYDAIEAASRGGAYAGAQVVGGAVSEKLLDYVLPEWKLVKIGASVVISLAEFVLGYANETARQAIFIDLYTEYKDNPEVFGNWLLKQSPAALAKDVSARWEADLPELAPYLWEGKGTDSGAAKMRERLVDTLKEMRADLVMRTSEARKQQAAMERRIEASVTAMKTADQAVKKAAKDSVDAIGPALRMLDEFNEVKSAEVNIRDAIEDITTTADEGTPGYGPAVYRPLGLKLDDLKGKIAELTLATKANQDLQHLLDELHERVAADLASIQEKYKAEHDAVFESYKHDLDGDLPNDRREKIWKAYDTYKAALGSYQALTAQAAQSLDKQIDGYSRLVFITSNKNVNAYARRITAIGALGAMTGETTGFQDRSGQPRDFRYDGIANMKLSGTLPEPKFSDNHGMKLLSQFAEQLDEALKEIQRLQRKTQDEVKELEEQLSYCDRTKELVDSTYVLEREGKALELEVLQDPTLTEGDRDYWMATYGGKTDLYAKQVRERFKSLSQSRSTMEDQKKSRETAIDEMQRDIEKLRQYVSNIHKTEEAIQAVPKRFTKLPTGDFTRNCGPEAPGEYFFFSASPTCSALVTGAARPLSAAKRAEAVSKALAEISASGAAAVDRRFNLGLVGFSKAIIEDYFSQGYSPASHLFLPREKYCCFITADYMQEETKKIRAIPLATATDGDGFRSRLTTDLEYSAVYTLTGFRVEPDKTDVDAVLAPTQQAFDGTARGALVEMTGEMSKKAALYREYLRKEKVVAEVNAQADALMGRLNEVLGEANAKQTAEAWAALAAMEPEVTAFEASYKAVQSKGDIPPERAGNIELKVEAAKSNIAFAKTTGSGAPGTRIGVGQQPGGKGQQPGGQQPGGQQPGGQQPGGQQPGGQQPGGQQPGGQQPGGQQPGGQQPGGQQPGGQQPGGQQPGGQQPGGQQPGGQQPGGQQPGGQQPGGQQPGGQQPGGQQPGGQQPGGQQPGGQQPGGQQPGGQQPGGQQPGGQQPGGQQPGGQQPGGQQPGGQQPGGQQPGGQQPGGQQPGGQQPGGQQPGGQQPGGQQPTKPEMPTTPAKPADPASPAKPQIPAAPAKPQSPAAPAKPAAPEVPKPETPVGPTKPKAPPTAEKPEAPAAPKPETPVGPTMPTTPSKPAAPETPAKPAAPAAPKPETPVGPTKPKTPPAARPEDPDDAAHLPTTTGQDGGTYVGGHQIMVDPVAVPQETVERNAVNKVYADFCKAYEGKSVSQVLRYIDNDWEAGDGTSISDLQSSLSSTFRVFNELKCTISNVKLTRVKQGRWRASYEMTIVGRIFAQNLKHEERSTVDEEVTVENGKAAISRTLKGNFWYFE